MALTPTQARINREKYTFYVIKSLQNLNNLKTGHVPYLGLELTMHVIKAKSLDSALSFDCSNVNWLNKLWIMIYRIFEEV